MPHDNFDNFHPGRSVSEAAERYTQLLKDKRTAAPKPTRPDQPQRDAAHLLTCPDSPVTWGVLSRHCFGIRQNDVTCAFCHETPDWILAGQRQELTA